MTKYNWSFVFPNFETPYFMENEYYIVSAWGKVMMGGGFPQLQYCVPLVIFVVWMGAFITQPVLGSAAVFCITARDLIDRLLLVACTRADTYLNS